MNKPLNYPLEYTENIKNIFNNLKEESKQHTNCNTPCQNFKYCGEMIDLDNDCYHGLCLNCDIYFGNSNGGKGILIEEKEMECPICYEVKDVGMFYPKCNHKVCIDCFKKCADSWQISNHFPYPELEDEFWYIEEIMDNKSQLLNKEELKMFSWIEDEKIRNWKKIYDYQHEIEEFKYEAEKNKHRCCICRQSFHTPES